LSDIRRAHGRSKPRHHDLPDGRDPHATLTHHHDLPDGRKGHGP